MDSSCPNSTQLTVSTRNVESAIVLTVVGDVDLESAPLLAQTAADALAANPKALVFDFTQVRFMASAGLNVLMSASHASAAVVAVIADSRAVRRPIVLSGVGRLIPLYTSLDNALEELAAETVMDSSDQSAGPAA